MSSKESPQDNRVYLYDSTLRDGAQTSTINFGVKDKIAIAQKLDELGIDYIEGGWPGANPTDDEFFANLPQLTKSKFCAFGMTRKNGSLAKDDIALNRSVNADVDSVCIFGKTWDFQLEHAIQVSEDENLSMIAESISHIVDTGKEAMFDAEHFFDGYKSNPEFALRAIKAAEEAGARWIILCDTNGGSLPSEIHKAVSEVVKHIPGSKVGIHCHNDTGNAVANSLAAVEAGARQIQGTMNGLGERCGNANLISIIPTLALKMGFETGISETALKNLVLTANFIYDIIDRDRDDFAPYVGKYAFAHKGGLHVSAVAKNPECYEHTNPANVGNKRFILVSDQAGKSNILSRLKEFDINLDDVENPQITKLVEQVKQREMDGYSYDTADASFEILARKSLAKIPNFFRLLNFKITDEITKQESGEAKNLSQAVLEIEVKDKTVRQEATGEGPVEALDKALRMALSDHYPLIEKAKLTDYKVRILNPSDGTKALTRVKIETTDETGKKWSTIGVSGNIVYASFLALKDSIVFQLIKEHN